MRKSCQTVIATDHKFDHKQHKTSTFFVRWDPGVGTSTGGLTYSGVKVDPYWKQDRGRECKDGPRYLWRLESDPELVSGERGKSRVDEDDGPSRARQSRHSSTAGLGETVWSKLLVAVHGSGRGNNRSHDDKNAQENCREKRTSIAMRSGGLDLPTRQSGTKREPEAGALWCMCQ